MRVLEFDASKVCRASLRSDRLLAVDALQEMSGTQWPVHRMRAEIYQAQGNVQEACRHAAWPLRTSIQPRDQRLGAQLQCH